MATLEELHQGLIKADAAGNAEDAKAFADAIRAMQQPQKPVGTGSAMLDTGNAIGTGYFRGLTSLAGLPVDTVANVIDLGKAAIGAPVTAITGKTPDALTITPRDQIVGSGQWLQNQAQGTALGRALLNPVNPEYEGGYAQTAGAGLTGVMRPNTWAQAANQAGSAVAGAMGGKAAYDATGNPALAVTAGLAPTALQQAATGAAQYAIRGGEQGRKEMAQRVQDLKNAGVEQPTLGLASGNKFIGGVENLLQNTPGAVGVMGKSRDAAIAGLQAKAQEAAELASQNRGAYEAGRSIQSGIKGFKDQFKERQGQLYDRMDTAIDPATPIDVSNTKRTLAALNSDIPGAPALSQQFKNGRIQAIEDAFKADTAVGRNTVMGSQNGAQLPFEAVKKTRTMVGNEIADANLASSVPRSKWNPLYGALSDDMQAAATAAGPEASKAFNRASDYTRSGIARLDRVEPFMDTTSPEQSFQRLASALKENTSTLQAVKKTLPEGARGDVAGTVIERLGKAKPGQQNEMGSAWSPETFLTNWNSMSPSARTELFSGFKNASQVKSAVEDVARATSMMRDNSKMWANPSGTGANAAARAVLGSVPATATAAAAGMMNPWVPAGIAGGLIANRQLAKMLTGPGAVELGTTQNTMSPQRQWAAAMAALLSERSGQTANQGN